MSVEHYRENIYVFRFNCEKERKSVLASGPWSFNNSLIVLEEPTDMGDMSEMKFDTVNFWVQVHNPPMICMKNGSWLGCWSLTGAGC